MFIVTFGMTCEDNMCGINFEILLTPRNCELVVFFAVSAGKMLRRSIGIRVEAGYGGCFIRP